MPRLAATTRRLFGDFVVYVEKYVSKSEMYRAKSYSLFVSGRDSLLARSAQLVARLGVRSV